MDDGIIIKSVNSAPAKFEEPFMTNLTILLKLPTQNRVRMP